MWWCQYILFGQGFSAKQTSTFVSEGASRCAHCTATRYSVYFVQCPEWTFNLLCKCKNMKNTNTQFIRWNSFCGGAHSRSSRTSADGGKQRGKWYTRRNTFEKWIAHFCSFPMEFFKIMSANEINVSHWWWRESDKDGWIKYGQRWNGDWSAFNEHQKRYRRPMLFLFSFFLFTIALHENYNPISFFQRFC